MKQLLISFLFFLFCGASFSGNKLLYKQEKDSVQYYYNQANNPKTTSSLIKAYVFFKNEVDKCIFQKDTLSAIRNLRLKAIVEYKLGDYYACETTAVTTLDLIKRLPKSEFTTESTVGIYNQLGRIYMELIDYKSALKYYTEALKIAKKQSNVTIIKNNIGLVYLEQKHLEKAEKKFLEVYKHSKSFNHKKDIARALDNLGYVQFKLHRPKSLDKLNEALKLRIEIDDSDGVYSSYKNLSLFYKENNDIDKANFYADKAYEIAKKLNSTSYIEDALSTIVSLSSNDKILQYKKIKDSIAKAKQVAENKYALVKYNYVAQEQIAQEQKLQKEKERTNKILFQALVVLVILTSVFIFLFIKAKHKKDKVQVVFNTENRISKKVHDEVANDIYHAMTKLQNSPKNEELLDDLEKIYNRTRDISKGISAVNVDANFNDLLYDLLISYKSNNVSVIANNLSKTDWDNISNVKRATIYRVLQELMTNMRKHSKASLVLIRFNQTSKKLVIDYKDNGVGCKLLKNNGLLNTENRMASINGNITFETEVNNGFKAKIII